MSASKHSTKSSTFSCSLVSLLPALNMVRLCFQIPNSSTDKVPCSDHAHSPLRDPLARTHTPRLGPEKQGSICAEAVRRTRLLFARLAGRQSSDQRPGRSCFTLRRWQRHSDRRKARGALQTGVSHTLGTQEAAAKHGVLTNACLITLTSKHQCHVTGVHSKDPDLSGRPLACFQSIAATLGDGF